MPYQLMERLQQALQAHKAQNAFFINEKYHSYDALQELVSRFRRAIRDHLAPTAKLIGLVANDDLETYATIIALWMEGKAYVPINPMYPMERNLEILDQAGSKYIFDSVPSTSYPKRFEVVVPKKSADAPILKPISATKDDIAYVIFTSGSTGKPKGVPITFGNLNGFINGIETNLSFTLSPSDRCLQMFELTFDMSVVSFLSPLLNGACVYTVPKNSIKYLYIYKLLKTKNLTVLIMVPSIIQYLRPYFKEINLPEVRYSCFAGGKLHHDVALEWNQCIPNAQILNYYGPTETTIYCGGYPVQKDSHNKQHLNILSIGKPFDNTQYVILDQDNKVVLIGITGELCIAGEQLFPGYLANEQKNKSVFVTKTIEGKPVKFYKSGDLCYMDEDGDFMFVGRADFQVKVRGYRVELGEVEFHAGEFLKRTELVALDLTNTLGQTELGLAIKSKPIELDALITRLREQLPEYMVPTQFKFFEELPHSVNGKVDRQRLKELFKDKSHKNHYG